VGNRAGTDGCEKFIFHRDWIPGLSSLWLVAVSTELSRPNNLPEEGLISKTIFRIVIHVVLNISQERIICNKSKHE
jgi:hypothetical protein